jgi:mRNA-degrading endonuclease HigB of HigAB toxin-antitoxin module
VIVCAMDYQRQAMFSTFVGTHKEYDEIKVEAIR